MGDKYQKNDLIPFEKRYEMLKILFENDNQIEISRLQANQKEISYAIDSFERIDNIYKNDDRFFIMGLDNFSKIKEWKDADKLLNNRKYIVINRNNIDISEDAKNVSFLHLNLNSSSSLARQKIKDGQNLKEILDDSTINYINKYGLYKEIKQFSER